MKNLKIYAALLPIMLALDILWLGLLMSRFYDTQLGALARRVAGTLTPHWPSAVLVYLLLPLGIVLFVLPKAPNDHLYTALWGALYGAILYGVYDLTNLAILANWPLHLALVDIVWGALLCGISALIASYIAPAVK